MQVRHDGSFRWCSVAMNVSAEIGRVNGARLPINGISALALLAMSPSAVVKLPQAKLTLV
jgi:hypothetical protein